MRVPPVPYQIFTPILAQWPQALISKSSVLSVSSSLSSVLLIKTVHALHVFAEVAQFFPHMKMIWHHVGSRAGAAQGVRVLLGFPEVPKGSRALWEGATSKEPPLFCIVYSQNRHGDPPPRGGADQGNQPVPHTLIPTFVCYKRVLSQQVLK